MVLNPNEDYEDENEVMDWFAGLEDDEPNEMLLTAWDVIGYTDDLGFGI